MHRLDPARRVGVLLDLLAQAGNVVVHRARRGERRATPHKVEEPLARDRFARRVGQQAQGRKFLGRQMQFVPPARGPLPDEVHAYITESQRARRAGGFLEAPQQCPHARQQFFRAERLHQIIIRARVESLHAVLDLAFGGEHEDGHRVVQAAQLSADRVAIELRQHEVEQDQVGLFCEGALQSRCPINCGEHAVACGGQRVGQRGAHGQFVFDEEDARVHDGSDWGVVVQVSSTGSSMVNRLPSPTALRTVTCPPCAATMCRTRLRPMPTPWVSRRNSEPSR
jgi:hypothetical protein